MTNQLSLGSMTSIAAAFVFLAGCASDPNDIGAYSLKHHGDLTGYHPYRPPNSLISANYRPVVGATGSTQKGEPQFISAGSKAEAQAIYNHCLNDGYHLLGTSSFSHLNIPFDASEVSNQDFLNEAKFVHAGIVLYYTVPTGVVMANVVVSSDVAPAVWSTTQVTAASGEELGTLQTQTMPTIKWNYANRYVQRSDNFVEFLAK
jgi:hypothetical protein